MAYNINNEKWYLAAGGWRQFTGKHPKPGFGDNHPPVIRVLGFDPGKVNFAWSVTDHIISNTNMVSCVVYSGLVPDMPISLKDELLAGFVKPSNFLYTKIGDYQPDSIIVERFMAQGLRVGTTIEISNIIAGILLSESMSLDIDDFHMVTAVTWKNAFNRMLGHKDALKETYKVCAATPHQVDASLMGCWIASSMLLCEPFESIADEDSLARFLESLELTSQHKLRNIRK